MLWKKFLLQLADKMTDGLAPHSHLPYGQNGVGHYGNLAKVNTQVNARDIPRALQAISKLVSFNQVGGDTWSTYVRPSGSRLPFYVRRTLIGYTEKI